MGRLARIAVAAVLLGADPAARAGESREELARALAGDLARKGFPVDIGKIRIEERSEPEMVGDLRKQFLLMVSPTYFEGMRPFLAALVPGSEGKGWEAGGGEAMRDLSARGFARRLLAYYQPGENRMVVKRTPPGDLVSSMTSLRHLVAHELVHAWQDQVRGIASLFRGRSRTIEGTRIACCLMEGEAEAVSLSLDQDLAAIEPEDLSSDLERIVAGEASSLVYSVGRTYMIERYRAGGWKAVAESMDHPPPSTEQILHPGKRGRDVPSEVDVPSLALPVLHEDVLGEFEIYRTLLLLEVPREEARVAAAGWDGDRLRVHRDERGRGAILWRTLWDRPEDATQFASALRKFAAGECEVRGRFVDWSHGSTEELGALAASALARGAGSPPPIEGDAATTREVEEAWAKETRAVPERSSGVWHHPGAGVRLPIPRGWEVTEYQGMPVVVDLAAAAKHGFAPNFNCQSLPVLPGKDLDALEAENRSHMTGTPGLKLDFMERITLDGVPVLHYSFHQTVSPTGKPLHFLGVIFLRGRRQIVVTATTLEALWEGSRGVLEATLRGIRIEMGGKDGKK